MTAASANAYITPNSTTLDRNQQIDGDLIQRMSVMNKNLSIMVGRRERLDRVMAMNHMIIYMYTHR